MSQPTEKIFRIKGFYSRDYINAKSIKKLIDEKWSNHCEVEEIFEEKIAEAKQKNHR